VQSYIPRGTARFSGTQAIATLVAGNETQFELTFTFPTNRTFLMKQASFMYRADNAEPTTFTDVAIAEYSLAALTQAARIEMLSHGNSGVGVALRSAKVWQPTPGYPRLFVDGPAGDSMVFNFSDPDTAQDGQVAGDFFWTAEFWMYDQEQVRHAAINTGAPVIAF